MKLDEKKIKQITARIIKLREDRGITQADLASRSKTPYTTLSKIERGDYVPSLPVLMQLGKVLKVPVSEILCEYRSPKPSAVDAFYAKYSELENLSKSDQKIMEKLIKRLAPEAK